MKLLKRTAFSLLGILLLILTIATILEKIYGTDFVNEYIYSSVPFVILWGVTANYFLIIHHKKANCIVSLLFFCFIFLFSLYWQGHSPHGYMENKALCCVRQGEQLDLFHRFQRNFPPSYLSASH